MQAIKFTPEGKFINVNITQEDVAGDNMVHIQVIDQGVGIPANKKDLVFERFGQVDSSLTRQAEGTGIGLHLVKCFVETMGGKITLQSEVGIGSTFNLFLPDIRSNKSLGDELILEKIKDLDSLHKAAAIQFSDLYF